MDLNWSRSFYYIYRYTQQDGAISREQLYSTYLPQTASLHKGQTKNIEDAISYLKAARLIEGDKDSFTTQQSVDVSMPFAALLLRQFRQLELVSTQIPRIDLLYITLLDQLYITPNQNWINDVHAATNQLELARQIGGISQEKIGAWKRVMEFLGLGYRMGSGFYCLYRPELLQAIIERWPLGEGTLQEFFERYLQSWLPCLTGRGEFAQPAASALEYLAQKGSIRPARQARFAFETLFWFSSFERNKSLMTTTTGMSGAHNDSLNLPCLATAGTKIFAPTADQRFLAGSAEFLRTHFPVQVQYHSAGYSTTLSEQDILHRLLEPGPATVGNRVLVLYGAAGSGKSELIRWLQTQISLQDNLRASVTLRISRTDLDVLHIAQRFRHIYSPRSFQANTLQRWEECRHKPRTLAKILVLTALEQLLVSDDQINALYYQLIDVVQTNLERCFAAMSQPTKNFGQYIELFSREDLEEILRNSVIPVPVEYETLRYHLLKTFRDQLLEGLDLPHTLKQIAQHVQQEKHMRPILFIDDLVQSINLFATDLLDYFITLEEGCWDVVVGITPNSLEASLRGRELLDRIAFLDTIDDRVEKLWLSDEYGLSSSFLNEMNCTEYARLYLKEYKRQNQQPCNVQCPAFHRCYHLEPDQPEDLLAPFNKEVLIRLFRSLPPEKGKVRYYTLYLRDILERVTRGEDLLSVVQLFVKSEQAAYHPNRHLAQVHELYGPLLDTEIFGEGTTDIARIYRFFDVQVSKENPQQPTVASLYRKRPEMYSASDADVRPTIDPGKEAIKGWLDGEPVNKQQLQDLRRGIVKAIKDGYLLDTLTRLYIAKPTRILRWAQTHLDTVPPVQLEGVDGFDGLLVQRYVRAPCLCSARFCRRDGIG